MLDQKYNNKEEHPWLEDEYFLHYFNLNTPDLINLIQQNTDVLYTNERNDQLLKLIVAAYAKVAEENDAVHAEEILQMLNDCVNKASLFYKNFLIKIVGFLQQAFPTNTTPNLSKLKI